MHASSQSVGGKRRGRPVGSAHFRALLASCESRDDESLNRPHDISDARQVRLARLASIRDEELGGQVGPEDRLLPNLAVGSELQQRLSKAARFLKDAKNAASQTFQSMFRRLFRKRRNVCNFSAEAEKMQCDRREVSSHLQQGACFLVQFNGYLLGSMLTNLRATASYEPLLLCLRRKYDETPTKIAVSFQMDGSSEKEQNATAKVIQTRFEVSMLLKHTSSGEYCFMDCYMPAALAAVDRTTAETTKAVQKDVLGSIANLEEACKHFPLCVQQVATDKFAANLRAEMLLQADMDYTVTSHWTCDVHKLAAVQTRTLSFVSGHISALIAGALALNDSGTLRGLRQALQAVLEDRVRLRLGEAPEDPFLNSYRAAVLDNFLPVPKGTMKEIMRSKVKKRQYMQRQIIAFFLNDDWQDDRNVWVWCPRLHVTRQQVLAAMAKFLVPALLPCKLPMFHRSKWTNFEYAYEWSGLLMLCHGLMKPMMSQFFGVQLYDEPARAAQASSDGDALAQALPNEEPEPAAAGQDARDMDIVTDNINWADFHVKMKQRFLLWVKSDPGSVLLVIAMAMRPVQALLHRFLNRGSKEWEKRERAKEAQRLPRSFSVVEAARLSDLKRFRADIDECFHNDMVGIPRAQHILQHQVLLFRMLSTAACSVEFYVYVAWRGFPIQLFACLDGNLAAANASACLLCPLSKKILEHFPDEELGGPDCQAVLRALASRFSLDIADVESRHASTRRINSIRSTQAPRAHLAAVSADWLCRCNSGAREDILGPTKQAEEGETPADEAGASDGKPKTHRANPWYAFLNEHCHDRFGAPGAMDTLKERFRNLSEEEMQRYRSMAQIAKLAVQRGLQNPYGSGVDARHISESSAGSLDELAMVPVGMLPDLQSAVQLVRDQQAEQRALLKQENEKLDRVIKVTMAELLKYLFAKEGVDCALYIVHVFLHCVTFLFPGSQA